MVCNEKFCAGPIAIACLVITVSMTGSCHANSQSNNSQLSVITNINIVAMDDSAPRENMAVVIESGKIREFIAEDDVKRLPGAILIDGHGGYLTPGLIDTHVHHRENVDYLNYVANGVTTIIGLGQGRTADEFRRIRDDILAGKMIGPRIYTTAQTVANHIQIEEPTAAREFVQILAAEGYDLVKIYNSISRDVFDAIVSEANVTGMPVFGHLPREFPVEYSLSHGLDVVAHAEEFYFTAFGGPRDQALDTFDGSQLPDMSKSAAIIDLMVENQVALIPNFIYAFTIMKYWSDENEMLADPELAFWHPALRTYWRESNGARRTPIDKRMLRERVKYAFVHEFTRRAHEAGVLIVAGSDAPVQGVIPGASLHGELRELIKTGLSHEESLAAATRSGGELIARYIDAQARVGAIAPGYDADLILVKGNPLDDIRHMSHIEGVMVDGVWFDSAELNELRFELAERYKD